MQYFSQVQGEAFLSLTIRRLLPYITAEIKLFEKNNTEKKSRLNCGTVDALGFSKKALKKKRKHDEVAAASVEKVETAEELPQEENLAVVESALQALDAIIKSSAPRLWNPWREEIDRLVVSLILAFPESPEASGVKLGLHQCLFSSVQIPASGHPSSLPFALRIFSTGKHDSSFDIRALCCEASAVCVAMIHSKLPAFPSGVHHSAESHGSSEQTSSVSGREGGGSSASFTFSHSMV